MNIAAVIKTVISSFILMAQFGNYVLSFETVLPPPPITRVGNSVQSFNEIIKQLLNNAGYAYPSNNKDVLINIVGDDNPTRQENSNKEPQKLLSILGFPQVVKSGFLPIQNNPVTLNKNTFTDNNQNVNSILSKKDPGLGKSTLMNNGNAGMLNRNYGDNKDLTLSIITLKIPVSLLEKNQELKINKNNEFWHSIKPEQHISNIPTLNTNNHDNSFIIGQPDLFQPHSTGMHLTGMLPIYPSGNNGAIISRGMIPKKTGKEITVDNLPKTLDKTVNTIGRIENQLERNIIDHVMSGMGGMNSVLG